jgi:UDP-glucuronate 4-epimerase
MEPRFLVTGAHGCIGAWVVRELVTEGRPVATFDLSSEPRRLRLLIGDRVGEVPHAVGDITDQAALERALDQNAITHVIHLAALQVPLVRTDPPLGARVNVLGTVNVFEAASRRKLAPIVYASSIAALDADGGTVGTPSTLYGVFKRANEQTAAVYYAEKGVASVGLRPHTVYGIGRDQGISSAPTMAMMAAAAGVPYAIPYGGVAQLQLARDVARWCIAASLAGAKGAQVHNLPGRAVAIAEVLAAIAAAVPGADVDCAEQLLPFPAEVDSASFAALVPDWAETALTEGVAETIEQFRELIGRGLIAPPA